MPIDGDGGMLVPSPVCEEAMFGLMSAAEVDPRAGGDEWARGLQHDVDSCADLAVVSVCPPLPEQRKTSVRGFDTREVDPFAVYAGWGCSATAARGEEPWDNAGRLLEQGWKRTVERTFWTGVDQDDQPIRESIMGGGPVDLTPVTGAVDPSVGVALLESFAGDCMSCVPTIHMSRGVGILVAERNLVRTDLAAGKAYLPTGTHLALGGGYPVTGPGGDAVDPGEAWIAVTGPVRVTYGPAFFAPGRGDLFAAVDRGTNDVTVFAERFVAVQLGCCLGVVRVTLSPCCC